MPGRKGLGKQDRFAVALLNAEISQCGSLGFGGILWQHHPWVDRGNTSIHSAVGAIGLRIRQVTFNHETSLFHSGALYDFGLSPLLPLQPRMITVACAGLRFVSKYRRDLKSWTEVLGLAKMLLNLSESVFNRSNSGLPPYSCVKRIAIPDLAPFRCGLWLLRSM